MAQSDDAPSAADLPADPALTCSLYATGATEQAIFHWILPFRERWPELGVDASTYLWMWRHARHGEHLKLRVHAIPSDVPALRDAAEETARGFLERLGPAPDDLKRHVMPWPAVDDDEDEEPLPEERSFRLTRYRRQPPIFGSPSLCVDETYIDRFCRCLGSAHHWLLDELSGHEIWPTVFSFHQLTFLITTAIDIALRPEEAGAFLASYRDWLIRLPLLRQGADQAAADAWTAKLHQKAHRMATPELADRLAEPWQGLPHAATAWRQDLQTFCEHAKGLSELVGEQRYLPLAKVLLALANPLGYGLVDQAAVAHLLLFLVDPERAAESIRLKPEAV